ncbi:MAG TPA: alpha/beta fold hydrolase [Rubrobacteraceae bacterium]|nr:alpha/beta fold hydrolase [Rubrobacteraceae bacterium]
MASSRPSSGMMSYREFGEGPGDPVVLLHAFPLDSRMFEPQAEVRADLRRLITPDYPGFGRSPSAPAQPDVRYYAEAMRGLLDRLGLERVVLGGVSMGGYVVFECLRLFPQRVSGLVLANTRPEPDSEEARENRKKTARRVAEEGVVVLVELQMERLLAPDTLENNERVVEKVRTMILESNPNGVVAALGAMRERPDSTTLLEEIEVPTLVIGGEHDGISSPEVMGAMAEKIPDSRHVTLPGAGHLANLEAPAGFNAALKELLEERL